MVATVTANISRTRPNNLDETPEPHSDEKESFIAAKCYWITDFLYFTAHAVGGECVLGIHDTSRRTYNTGDTYNSYIIIICGDFHQFTFRNLIVIKAYAIQRHIFN